MEEEIKKLTKKKATAQSKFTRIYNQFQAGILRNEELYILQSLRDDLETAFKNLEERHTEYIELLDTENKDENKLYTAAETNMETQYGRLIEVRSRVNNSANEGNIDKLPTAKFQTVRVKKLDAPSFGGNLTEYPSFIRDYETHMKPVYGNDPYALKKCLHGEALLTVKGVDDDFNEMKERLDYKYGRPDKLASAIVNKLKNLKAIPEGYNMKFIEFVEIVEQCWLEVKKLDMKEEMNNVTMVTEIEKLMPFHLLREWCIQKDEFQLSHTKNQFPDLLKFLIREKQTMEYIMESTGVKRKPREVKLNLNALVQEKEECNTVELLLNAQKQNDETLNKVVQGLTQVIESMKILPVNRQGYGDNYQFRTPINRQGYSDNYQVRAPINKKCWLHKSDNHEISICSTFLSMDNKTKIETLRNNGACYSCLNAGHLSRNCPSRNPCDQIEKGMTCNKFHHHVSHPAFIEGCLYHIGISNVINIDRKDNIILMISTVLSNSQPLTTFWDPGSNTSLITKRAANLLGLKGKTITLSITKAGNETTTSESKEYKLPLKDLNGNIWTITVYEMMEITGKIESKDLTEVSSLFHGIGGKTIDRPSGSVDLLIGTDCCTLLPNKVAQIDNLQLMKIQFGYCLRGSHPSFGPTSDNVCKIITSIGGIIKREDMVFIGTNADKMLESFLNIESLGTACNPKCGNCQCKRCPVGTNNYTIKEERELHMIENGLQCDPLNQKCVALI